MVNKSVTPLPWYVAYTKPRQERIALENLEQQQFNTYLPLFKKLKKETLKTYTCTVNPSSLPHSVSLPSSTSLLPLEKENSNPKSTK